MEPDDCFLWDQERVRGTSLKKVSAELVGQAIKIFQMQIFYSPLQPYNLEENKM